MNYIIEATFVGVFTLILHTIISFFIKNFFMNLLVVGFIKHQLGYYLGLQTYFFNYGYACVKAIRTNNNENDNTQYNFEANNSHLLYDSIFQSIAFLILGSILSLILKSKMVLFFVLGVTLHIMSEKLLINQNFCEKECSQKTSQ